MGRDLYVVYNAFTTPYRFDTTSSRSLVGVVKHAAITGGVPGAFGELDRGTSGDPRGSSTNSLVAEFLGDYVYAVATNTYGAGVWNNDTRNAAVCTDMNDFGAPSCARSTRRYPSLSRSKIVRLHLATLTSSADRTPLRPKTPPLSLIESVSASPAGVRICRRSERKSLRLRKRILDATAQKHAAAVAA